MRTKLNFSRASVLLMYLAIIGWNVAGFITGNWPPDAATYSWHIFWLGQGVVTCSLTINKGANDRKLSFQEAVVPFINYDNAAALAERFIGVDLKYSTPMESAIVEKAKDCTTKKTTTKKCTTKKTTTKKKTEDGGK